MKVFVSKKEVIVNLRTLEKSKIAMSAMNISLNVYSQEYNVSMQDSCARKNPAVAQEAPATNIPYNPIFLANYSEVISKEELDAQVEIQAALTEGNSHSENLQEAAIICSFKKSLDKGILPYGLNLADLEFVNYQ